MMSKITEDKRTGPNYSDLSKKICLYLRSIRITNRLEKDPPTDDSKERWLEDDACLFLQIHNSIDGKGLILINYYEFVKELMKYRELKDSSLSLAYLMCVNPFIALRNKIGPSQNSSWIIKIHMRN